MPVNLVQPQTLNPVYPQIKDKRNYALSFDGVDDYGTNLNTKLFDSNNKYGYVEIEFAPNFTIGDKTRYLFDSIGDNSLKFDGNGFSLVLDGDAYILYSNPFWFIEKEFVKIKIEWDRNIGTIDIYINDKHDKQITGLNLSIANSSEFYLCDHNNWNQKFKGLLKKMTINCNITETWNINKGTGNKITGINGNAIDIIGATWQEVE